LPRPTTNTFLLASSIGFMRASLDWTDEAVRPYVSIA
jgi:hypothetical protein